MTYYAVTWAEIRQVAREYGYALTLHGSLSRDLDVVAIPWIDDAGDELDMLHAICEKVGGYIPKDEPSFKPHGRKSWVICLGGASAEFDSSEFATYIDISIMPKNPKPAVKMELCYNCQSER
jgi:hypothetical protein